MSYCHLVSAGINLANGFGPQPAQLIRDRVNGATCLLSCGNSCDAPTPLGVTALTTTSATLTWGNVGAVSYDLRWKPSSGSTWTNVTGLATNSYGLGGLSPLTGYDAQVRSVCAGGTQGGGSEYSNTHTFATVAAPCEVAAPILVAAKVDKIVTLGTPHYGTALANIMTMLTLGTCVNLQGCKDMQQGSTYLNNLNAGSDVISPTKIVSIRT